MKCCNCSDNAVFYVNDPGANPLDYCRRCLPTHLRVRSDLGHFNYPPVKPPRQRKA